MVIGKMHIGKYKYWEIKEIFDSVENGISFEKVLEKFKEIPNQEKPNLWQAYMQNNINHIGYQIIINNIVMKNKKIDKCKMEFYFENDKLVSKRIEKENN